MPGGTFSEGEIGERQNFAALLKKVPVGLSRPITE
jgi:hypothetical protein